jgi:chitinase
MRVRKLAVVATALLGAGLLTVVAGNGTASAATAGGAKFAYYDQWSIYGNAYYPRISTRRAWPESSTT